MKNEESKIEILLSQWQTCVEAANSISQRRDVMNNLFVTLNLALIAATSVVFNIKSIMIIVAGIALCVVWMQFIRNFKLLNEEKFKIINELECELPFQPFKLEWDSLQANKKYKEETQLEKILPIAFIVIYVALAVFIFLFKI